MGQYIPTIEPDITRDPTDISLTGNQNVPSTANWQLRVDSDSATHTLTVPTGQSHYIYNEGSLAFDVATTGNADETVSAGSTLLVSWDTSSSSHKVSPAASVTVDSAMSDSSANPVENQIVKAYIDATAGNALLSQIVRITPSTGATANYTDFATAAAAMLADDYMVLPPVEFDLAADVAISVDRIAIVSPFGRAVLRRDSTHTTCTTLLQINSDDSYFSGFEVDGLASGTQTGNGLVFLVAGDRNTVHDCRFVNAYTSDGDPSTSAQCCQSNGDNNTFSNCHVENAEYQGFRSGGDYCRFIQCSSHNCLLSFGLGGTDKNLCEVIDCLITSDNATDGAINVNPGKGESAQVGLQRLRIQNLVMDCPSLQYGSGGNGIKIQDVGEIDIDGLVMNIPLQGTADPAIRFNNYCPYVSIKNFDISGWISNSSDSALAVTPDHTTEVFTKTSHGLRDGQRAFIMAGTTLPSGLETAGGSSTQTEQWYYIANKTDDTFQLSTDRAGSSIAEFTDNGTGDVDVYICPERWELSGRSTLQSTDDNSPAFSSSNRPIPDLKIDGIKITGTPASGLAISIVNSNLNRIQVDNCEFINDTSGNIYVLQTVEDTRVLSWGDHNKLTNNSTGTITYAATGDRREMFNSVDGKVFRDRTAPPTTTAINWNVGDEWIDETTGTHWYNTAAGLSPEWGYVSKALTAAAATAFVEIGVASGSRCSGQIWYEVNADDATDFQVITGMIDFCAVNKAGAETVSIGVHTQSHASSSGTLTVTFDTDTTPTNGFDIRANAASSLSETTLDIRWRVVTSSGVTTITPQ